MKAPVTNDWKKQAILLSMIAMLTGLLFSRVLLSSGLIFFAALTLVHKDLRSQLIIFFTSPFLWGMALLFLIPLISGLWSDDLSKWSEVMRIKLPLLLLPLCFAGLNNFECNDWEKIAWAFLIIIIAGICYSMWQYIQDTSAVHAGYLRSHTIKTPVGNDHVRFSLLVTIGIQTIFFLLVNKGKRFSKATRFFLWTVIGGFVIYLHILAVRTGLLCFYAGVLIFLICLLWKRKNKLRTAFLIIILFTLPLIAYFVFPTFKNRVSYLRYDLSFVKKDIYMPGSNDGNRLRSIKAGWDIQNEQPFSGVGFGDIEAATGEWYQLHYPGIIRADQILPSSEWMIYAAGSGWPGFIIFINIMLLPFFLKRPGRNISWWVLNISMALSYLFDIGLEVQYGVFVHAFFLLWWYKRLLMERQ
jgi:hypothetical protein